MRIFKGLAVALAVPLAAGSVALTAGTAHAAGVNFTAVTHVKNNADDGGNGNWAYDNFTRTLKVRTDTSVTPATGDRAYKATVTDTGTWRAILGAYTPNQNGAHSGLKIKHNANGTFTGTASYRFQAPVADVPSAANVAKTLNDNFTKPTSGPDSTNQWYLQAFLPNKQSAVTGTIQNTWKWTYKDACESWTDSAANNDGQSNSAGNITGRVCPVPVLYGGQAVYVAPTRENVEFKQTIASWDKFTIVGPGAINGHQGWVNAKGGGVVNMAVYSGLEANHGYTVLYQPVVGQGSSKAIPGTHQGYVYFVSNNP
jgi:hypothetical protein